MLLSSSDLKKARAFYIYKLMQIAIIGKDKNLILVAFQIVMPSL